MDPSKLASWMSQENVKVNELSRTLSEHIFAVPSGNLVAWLKELAQRFDHFEAHLRRMMHIEEEDGYLLPVLEQRPTLTKEVELLRHQHDELRRLMDDLHATVHGLSPRDNLLIRDYCARLQAFLGHVLRHEEHENHIVIYTFTEDIGTDH